MASLYSPHVPSGDPWFEGWYSRISTPSVSNSIGVIFGHYPKSSGLDGPAVYCALIVDLGDGQPEIYETHPHAATVLVNGANVAQDPDVDSPPNFSINTDDGAIKLSQRGAMQSIHVNISGAILSATFTDPEPWGPNGASPEGWAGKLPFLGLHWFVYSLSSAATFELWSPVSGKHAGTGHVHQEKNWGTAFPTSWMWAEARGSGKARLALAGGPAPIGPIVVPNSFLVGYRSEKLTWNFHPQDPALSFPSVDACNGMFNLTVKSATRMLKIRMEFIPDRNGGLFTVGGPTHAGFKDDSVENYRTKIMVSAYSGILHRKHEETVVFTTGALEFGGDHRCKNKPHLILV